MMKLKTISRQFVCLVLFVGAMQTANAQLGERIKQRVKESTTQKVEDKIVNKTNEKTDQALDSLFKKRKRPGATSSDKNDNEKSAKSAGTGGFNFAGMTNAKYESSYTLTQEFKIEITSKEKGKKDKLEVVNMDMFYGENCYMAIVVDEKQKTAPKNLMDLSNNTSIMLNDEDMSGMAISMDFMSDKISEMAADQDSTVMDESYSFVKTGKTKTIAGYLCEEYIIETDDTKMNVWYTDEITIDMHQNLNNFAMFASFSTAISKGTNGELVGMMMESHMVEKTGDQGTFDYIVKEVNLKTTTINMSDYTFINFGGN